MGWPADHIEIGKLSPSHRKVIEAFESLQSTEPVAWQMFEGSKSLSLPDGTRFLPTGQDEKEVESWWSKVGAVLLVGGFMAASGAWALRGEHARGLLTLAAVAAVILLGIGALCLLRGRRPEKTADPHIVYRHGLILLRDALLERAGSDGFLCRVFPIERIQRFHTGHVTTGTSGGHLTLYVDLRLDSGEVETMPIIGKDSLRALETWLIEHRSHASNLTSGQP